MREFGPAQTAIIAQLATSDGDQKVATPGSNARSVLSKIDIATSTAIQDCDQFTALYWKGEVDHD